jgi:putative transposase
LVCLWRSTLYYKAIGRDDTVLTARILELARKKKRWGAAMIHSVVKREKLVKNHKRTARIYYKVLKLSLRRRSRKKFRAAPRIPLPAPKAADQCWSMDFVHDALYNCRKLKCLNIVDDFTRECLAIEVDKSIRGTGVVQVLERLKDLRGLPAAIRMDNGPEFISKAVDEWAFNNHVTLDFIDPGKPAQNAYIESFNGKFRDELLNGEIFYTLQEATVLIEKWRMEYNTFRPHSSLNYRPPAPEVHLH